MFLGSWCLLYERKHVWSKLDYEIVPYHWINPYDMAKDANIVRSLYENLLVEVTNVLNTQHQVEWPLRSWRILIGPWLLRFLEILYDRWESIQALDNYNISAASFTDIDWDKIVPWDFSESSGLSKTDEWNYYIFSKILKYQSKIKLEESKISPIIHQQNINQNNKIFSVRNFILYIPKLFLHSRLFHEAAMYISRRNNYYLYNTYIKSKMKVMELSLLLNDYPILTLDHPALEPIDANKEMRKKLHLNFIDNDNFEKFIREILPYNIPTIYLEGFDSLLKKVSKSGFSKTKKGIITTIGIYKDEVFKAWVSQSVVTGTKLIVGQHGGEYGSCLFSFPEEHEIKISDLYLTWGWKYDKEKAVPIPAPIFIQNKNKKWNKNGSIVIICTELSRYMTQMHPNLLLGKRSEKYINILQRLIELITTNYSGNLIVKLSPNDAERGNPIKPRVENKKYSSIKIVKNSKSLDSVLQNSRLSIHLNDGTTFLESLGNNQPSLLLIDPELYPIRKQAKPFYKELINAGILHDSPDSANRMINKIYENVGSWWNRDDVVLAKRKFCNQFARHSKKPLKEIRNAIIST